MAGFALFIVLVIVAVMLMLRWIRKRAVAASGLLLQGEKVTGEIVKAERVRLSRTDQAYRVRYAFTTKDGAEHAREIDVKATEFDQYAAGQPIDIVYDPKNPDNSMLRSAYDQAQAAARRGP